MALTPLEIFVIGSTVLEFNPLLQVYKSVKIKKTEELSVGTFAVIFLIGSLWLYYGISIGNIPLIVGNCFKLFSALAVIVVYFIYRKNG